MSMHRKGRTSTLTDWTRAVLLAGVAAAPYAHLAIAQAPADSVIYLDQAWSQADREMYYQKSQGSVVMSYDIFLNLEMPGSQELFRSDANFERWGWITQPANPKTNPDGLPIGLARTTITEGPWKGDFVGLTCAACHNAQLNYKGKRIRVDGGVNNTLDLMAYMPQVNDAMQATLADAAKFDRLAARVGATSADAKSALRKRVESEAAAIQYYATRTILTPATPGPSRMDAIAQIGNRSMMIEPNIPENWIPPMAPSKPPFLWN